MNAEDIMRVQKRTLERLAEHFERVMMPDDEYIPLIWVVVSAGASLLHDTGADEGEVEKFRRNLTQEAKTSWLASCAENLGSDPEQKSELTLAAKDFDRIIKKCMRQK